MLKVTIETEDMSVMLKDNDAYSIEDCNDMLETVKFTIFGVRESEEEAIYIQQDQPHDHIQHEGM